MDKKEIQVKFGSCLRKYRIQSGKSQEDLAHDADISAVYLGIIERGERCPTIDTLLKLSSVLNISPSRLLDFADEHEDTEAYSVVKYALNGVPAQHKATLARMFEALAKVYGDEVGE